MNNRGGYCYKYDEINYKVFENDQIERLARSAATENGMVFKKVVSSTQKEIPPAMEITLKASKDGKTWGLSGHISERRGSIQASGIRS
ncbi:hypothetical protein O6P43_021029 [Quillaja saponaria]|uniref:Uncharacterized protein n=1 Tax=Quillaja saponaria TaxID=32244 RepID=A0AAD7PLV8_QUISA|nr:hypothetical protein O6P43_021029 [Quillaja saponaria]